MSRIARNPIDVPDSVKVEQAPDNTVTVSGNLGAMSYAVYPSIQINLDGNKLSVTTKKTDKHSRAMLGTTYALLRNNIVGVSQGHIVDLELRGVGYRAQKKGDAIKLTLGKSHEDEFQIPKGVSVSLPSQTEIKLEGCDKALVTLVASKIRGLRPPENYKGKGIRLKGEYVIIKETSKKK